MEKKNLRLYMCCITIEIQKGELQKMAIVQFRVDDNVKKRASELFESLGFDLSTAIRSFLRRSIMIGGFPYPMLFEDKVYDRKVSEERQEEVKALLKRLSEIEDEEFKNALDKAEDIADDDKYGEIVLETINEQIHAVRENLKKK